MKKWKVTYHKIEAGAIGVPLIRWVLAESEDAARSTVWTKGIIIAYIERQQ